MKDIIEIDNDEFKCAALIRERFGITNLAVANWVKQGLLPPPFKLGNRNYYSTKRIDELMRNNSR